MTVARKVLLGYKVGRTIGRGAFSKVKLAEHRGTRETVAVKIISKERLESSYRKRVEDLKKKKRREFEKTQRNTPRKVNNSSPTGYTKTTRRINSEALIATFPWNFRLLSSPRAYSHTCEKLGKDQKVQKLCDKHEAQPNTAVTSKSIRKKLDVDITEILPGHFSRRLSKEVRLLQVLEHPHIIRLYQVIETEQEYYIVTQYAPGGEMIDFIARKGKLPETQARYFFRQIISAVDHCHKSGILHRDLKLENILLSEKNEVLISDFGLGRTFKPENLCDTFCGTPLYASPELVSGVQYQGPPADVWAMGVVLFAMIAGRHPFRAKNMSQLYKKIREVDYKMPSCSESLKKLFKSIFVKSAEARATVDDLRLHEWVMEGFTEPPLRLKPVLQYDGTKIENCTAIQFESNAMMYQFKEMPKAQKYSFPVDEEMLSAYSERSQLLPITPRKLLKKDFKQSIGCSTLFPSGDLLLCKEMGMPAPVSFPRGLYTATDNTEEATRRFLDPIMEDFLRKVEYFSGDGHLCWQTYGFDSKESECSVCVQKHKNLKSSEWVLPYNSLTLIKTFRSSCFRSETAKELESSFNNTSEVDLCNLKISNDPYEISIQQLRVINWNKKQNSLSLEMRKKFLGSKMKDESVPAPEHPLNLEKYIKGQKKTKDAARLVRTFYKTPVIKSNGSAETLRTELLLVLESLMLHCIKLDNFKITCNYRSNNRSVELGLEVVKVWLLNSCGVKIKRLKGDGWLYKKVREKIVSRLNKKYK